MERISVIRTAALAVVVLAAAALSASAADETSFGYDCEDCPANWGNLSDDFAACFEGTKQSPIAFDRGSAKRKRLPRLRISYGESPLKVERKETNFEAFVEEGSNAIRIRGKRFDLVQFHFHSTAEHVVDGERAALEMHFVHSSGDGDLAVIGAFIEEGDNFDALDPLTDALPAVAATPVGEELELEAVDVDALLPEDVSSYRYSGSTTTPPCTEGVQWILLEEPLAFSEAQIEAIRATVRGFNLGFDNNRPIVERNGRRVTTDVAANDDDDDD